jgi:hypothetical protein
MVETAWQVVTNKDALLSKFEIAADFQAMIDGSFLFKFEWMQSSGPLHGFTASSLVSRE